MKSINKIAVLCSVFALTLVGCTKEIKSYCLETSDTFEYYKGKCFQASRNDVVDTVFVMNLPNNPEAPEDQYTYDLTWSKVVNTEHFSFTNGLEGKRIIEVFRFSDTILKINFDGKSLSDEQFGYIKISPSAFKSTSKATKGAYLYAYVAVGEASDLVNKPAQE